LARLGFDYDGVKAIRSDIIYAHGVGYGSDGPYAGRPAYDDIVQMASGMADLLSKTDGDPQPRLLPTLIADKVAGLFMAQAIMAGLIHRNATGQGQYIEVPMLEVTASFNLVEHFFGHTFDPPTGPWTYWRVTNPYRRPHPTKDGYIGLLPYDEQQWQKFFALAGVGPEIMQDPRFSTDDARRRNIQDLYAIMGEHTTQFTTQEWLDKLIPLDVPATAVARFEDLPNDPHLKAVGFFRRLRHPVAGDFVTVAPPVRYSATPANIYRLPPQLGEHTDEVLRELDSGDSANESHREGPDRAVTSSPAPL
jgi:crotonobetainyl-CoA:carnitine CoA-transferase CaiB-like acyl-CoA transferase